MPHLGRIGLHQWLRRGAPAAACVILNIVFAAGSGCEAIVNGEVGSFRCDANFDAGVCPPGQYCFGSTCVPGSATSVSCGSRTCRADERCAPKTEQCIAATTACTVNSCSAQKVCDFGTLQCVLPAAKQIGDGCQADAECQSGQFCAYSPVLTTDVVTADGLCTKPCCKSSDCPADFVCYGAGTGGNYCVNKGVLGRPALGSTAGGAACNASADCRSGICINGQCQDTCCNDGQCFTGTVCRAMSVQGKGSATKFVFGCGASPSNGTGQGQLCEAPIILGNYPPCTEGVCDSSGTSCRAPCCSSMSCSTSCDNTTAYNHGDTVTACSGNGNLHPGKKDLGETCSADSDCIGNRCFRDSTGAKYCSDACCTDADCASASGDLLCRPYDSGSNHYYLRCQRPAAATAQR